MSLSPGRPARKKPKKSAHGWGKYITVQIERAVNSDAEAVLKCRSQEEFERLYKIDLGEKVPWKSNADKVIAILNWIKEREFGKWDTENH